MKLLPHQEEAIRKLQSGSILCAGVGTGKSITALAYFLIGQCGSTIWADGNIGPLFRPKDLYIITTARKRDTHEWEAECAKFELEKMNEITITIDSWNNLHKYADAVHSFFIFDEQRVVGSGAWVKAFLKITKANNWILLSATPGDTWLDYIPVFVANGFYKNRTEFLRRHAVYNRYSKYPKIDKWLEVTRLELLRRKITVTMTYEKTAEPHWEDVLFDYDQELYETIGTKRWDPWKNEPIRDISVVCYLLRKAVASQSEFGMINHKPFKVNKRALWILHMAFSKHPKLIVFYNYDYELEAIKETINEMRSKGFCESKPLSVAEWNGHKHEPLPDGDRWIYLVQYTAGAEGWNCVETDTIVFYSQNYSYKSMTQAAGRIDRMNTPFDHLYYYVLKSDSSIDKAVAKALRCKKTFNAKNFEGGVQE